MGQIENPDQKLEALIDLLLPALALINTLNELDERVLIPGTWEALDKVRAGGRFLAARYRRKA